MTSSAIRRSFLDFFREKEHTIVPSSSLMPDSPNLLFTNAGMNQFVPIFLGQSACPYKPARAADTQKCIRAGGKHNDLEDVGFDTYHHTFFEMLGNWSFGDYFKKEAIAWAWELVLERWKFPASRIYATVYCPYIGEENWEMDWLDQLKFAIESEPLLDDANFPEPTGKEEVSVGIADTESCRWWAEYFRAVGLDPLIHIVPGNKKDNFWMMGDTGPCGPCSELHVDLTPGSRELDEARQRAGRELVNKGNARCIEIWNLVFIEFNAQSDGRFLELPAKHVDTGMGFERVVSIIQGTKNLTDFSTGKISNYETDVFRPIFDKLEELTGKKYGSTLPASAQNLSEQEKIDVAFRVVADHIRTLSFSIADGIRPSNEGRGYVLRRILRRAVNYGNNLGQSEPFLAKLVPVLGETMGEIFPEVIAQAESIKTTLTQEEESFFRNLERGKRLFEEAAEDAVRNFESDKDISLKLGTKTETIAPRISGKQAFELYDTYGYPLDLTELKARERGWTVDVDEFNRLLEQQKNRGRAAQAGEVVKVAREFDGATKFTYDEYTVETVIRQFSGERISPGILEASFFVPEATTLYPAMGGQIGDQGVVEIKLADGGSIELRIQGVERIASGAIFHDLEKPTTLIEGFELVRIKVDAPRRARIEAHHSGTHLLNWALRKVLGNTIVQKGSYVGPDRLRFDFSHGAAVTPEQIAEIEKLINEKIGADVPVKWEERPYAEVKGDPGILQFFGDKYGEMVRVVSIGDFSRELCGGTHVRQSSKVGYFKILSEGAIAAGIRRIEAASGVALVERVKERLLKQDDQYEALRQRKADLAALKPVAGEEPEALWHQAEVREEFLRQANAEIAQHEKEGAKRAEAGLQSRATKEAPELIAAARMINEIPFLVHQVAEAAYLPFLADALKARWQGVAVLAATEPGKVALLCTVSPAYAKKIQAGKIIQAIAPLVGGKGGGRPELAQGGGTQPENLPAALAKAEELVQAVG